jgi:hypothetical protein
VQVETVAMKAGLEDWQMNFIQGIVNQLQFDFGALKPSSKNKRTKINRSYRMMEVCIDFKAHCCLHV